MNNSLPTFYVILLCNLTDAMAKPWLQHGYHVIMVDPQHPSGINTDGNVTRIGCVISECLEYLGSVIRTGRVVFVMGFPPCTDVAVSGSRWFESKRAIDPHFQAKAALVAEQCRMIGALSGARWAFENPVSVFSSIFGRSQYAFHPYQFTGFSINDNYTKLTCLWAGGGFVMPDFSLDPRVEHAIKMVKTHFGRMVPKRKALELLGDIPVVADFYPDNRIHECPPGEERGNIRSATPVGFSEAVCLANLPAEHLVAAMDKAA